MKKEIDKEMEKLLGKMLSDSELKLLKRIVASSGNLDEKEIVLCSK